MRKLTLLFALVFALAAHAYDFCVTSKCEGYTTILYYAINPDGKTVTVTFGPEAYSKPIVEIPSEVADASGKSYTVTVIGAQAFQSAATTTLFMPNTITDIQERAFEGSMIYNIRLSTALKRIGPWAFSNTGLESMDFPEGLEEIAEGAFCGCLSFKKLDLPSAILSIGSRAFEQCPINTLDLPDSLTLLDESAFSNCEALGSVKLSKGLKRIVGYAFNGCTHLSKVEFQEGLEEIGDWAFSSCPLRDFKLPATLKSIGCYNFNALALDEFTIPDNVTHIGQWLFGENKIIKKIVFGKGLTVMPAAVCHSCESLVEVEIPENITSFEFTSDLSGGSAFYGCRSLSHIELPDGITSLPGYDFSGCSSLTDLKLPAYLKEMGVYSFSSCTSLKHVVLPVYLENIGNAFEYCSGLTDLYVPNSVKLIYGGCFNGVSGNIHMQSAMPPLANWGVVNNGIATLYVPRGAKKSYVDAEGWNCFKEILEEEVKDPIFGIWGNTPDGGGRILLNGNELENEIPVAIEYGQSATLTFKPNEDCVLLRVLVNDEDVTSKVADDKYMIDAATTNYVVSAYFKTKPITVNLRQGNGGSMDVYSEMGESFTCRILADEGWKINSVYLESPAFTGDVTSEVGGDGVYTIPELFYDAWLSVSFEDVNSGVEEVESGKNIRVYSSGSHSIVIEGGEGLDIAVYDVNGISAARIQSASWHEIIEVASSGVYLVKAGARTFKVAV